MKTLRTAVVGLGRIGWETHIPQIKKHEGFELIAATDTSPDRIKELEKEYGVPGFTDIEKMMKAVHPDLVVIASPTHLHKDHIRIAMENGADVFAEKPLAKSLDEVHEICDIVKRYRRKIMVFQPRRADAQPNAIKKIIAENKIGPVYMIKRSNAGYFRRNDWQAQKKYGGGMLNNYGAHFIDQLRYILDEDVEIVSCITDRIATLGDAEDVVKLIMKSSSGVTLDLDINQATAYPIPSWMVFGKYGTIFAQNDFCSEFKVRYIVPEECPKVELQTTLAAANRKYSPDTAGLPWHEEAVPVTREEYGIDFYQKCYEYFAEDKAPFVPFEQTVRLMTLIDEGYKISGN